MKKKIIKKTRHIRRTFYLYPDISEWLKAEADREQRSVSSLLCLILRKQMKK